MQQHRVLEQISPFDRIICDFQYESLLIGGLRGTSTRCLSLCFGKCLKSSRRLGLLSLNFELRYIFILHYNFVAIKVTFVQGRVEAGGRPHQMPFRRL